MILAFCIYNLPKTFQKESYFSFTKRPALKEKVTVHVNQLLFVCGKYSLGLRESCLFEYIWTQTSALKFLEPFFYHIVTCVRSTLPMCDSHVNILTYTAVTSLIVTSYILYNVL